MFKPLLLIIALSTSTIYAQPPVVGELEAKISLDIHHERNSILTAERILEARELILKSGEKKQLSCLGKEFPCLTEAYLLSEPESEDVILFLQARSLKSPNKGAAYRVAEGEGLLVKLLGDTIVLQSSGMTQELMQAQAPAWLTLWLPLKEREESLAKAQAYCEMEHKPSRASLQGNDPLLNEANYKAATAYMLTQNPAKQLHGSLYGSLPYYSLKNSHYGVFLTPDSWSMSYQRMPSGVGSVSYCPQIGLTSWYAPRYMVDMTTEVMFKLLLEMGLEPGEPLPAN